MNAENKPGEDPRKRYQTIIFEDAQNYIDFTREVFSRFRGRGLGFTNVPLRNTLRAQQWLLDEIGDNYPQRPVTGEDVAKHIEEHGLRGMRPYDLENLRSFLVPGVPNPEKTTE